MNSPTYLLSNDDENFSYTFFSEGRNGIVAKGVLFQLVDSRTCHYNLAFGDIVSADGDFDDYAISDNQDTEKILATVAHAVHDFMQKMPNARVMAEGSTPERTRLYQIKISKHFDDISRLYNVFGFISDQWQPFEKQTRYEAFLITAKEVNLIL